MNEPFIRKIQPDLEGVDFDGLRKEGIRLVQEVSGDVWTDFNLHDPGVTILEAICYALTDLIYRAGFSAADCLTSSVGKIDYKQQALYRTDEILPCCPLTENDYRKLILNAFPNIDNVWVKRFAPETGGLLGLFQIYVQLSDKVKNQSNPDARKAYANVIKKIYAENRNLCEDIHGVEIVKSLPYSLRGEIELEGKESPASILAEIYFECEQYLSPKISVHSYEQMHKNGMSMEDLFTGVLTAHGYIAEDELHPWRGYFSISDMYGKISQIKGVKDIKHLTFVDGSGNEIDSINLGSEHSYSTVACLRFPPLEGDVGMRLNLYKAGKPCQVSLRDVETEFDRLDYVRQTLRCLEPGSDWVGGMLPASTFRNSQEYYSIQNNFPDVYGLNTYGVPDSAPETRKAQAAQLKAYLLFFEQIKANFLQNLQEVSRLFSVEEPLTQSYFYQVLKNDTVPNVEEMYLDGVDGMGSRLAELLSGFDDYGDRRNRVLDYLLGIYGEKFSQNSLRHFFAEGANVEDEKIRNKIALLKEIVDISKNRAMAFDYRKPADGTQNRTGLKRKLQLLLGARTDTNINAPPKPPEGPTGREGDVDAKTVRKEASADIDKFSDAHLHGHEEDDMQIVEHILLRPSVKPSHDGCDVPNDFYGFRVSVIFSSAAMEMGRDGFQKLAEETVALNCPAHIYPEIFWLEAEPMGRFKALYSEWLEAKRMAASQSGKTDAAALQLIRFLLEIRKKKNE